MAEHAVVVAGAGPTGLMLAGELALAGIDVALLERRGSHEEVGSRAAGLHSRTIEVFDQRGIAERFLAQGRTGQVTHFSGIFMSIEDFPTRHPYALGLLQHYTEKTLAAWIDELGVPIYYNAEAVGLGQDDVGVDVALADGSTLRGQYLVGCDGGRSTIRKAAGIGFPGHDPSCSAMLVDAEITEQPLEFGLLRKPGQAFLGILPFEEGWSPARLQYRPGPARRRTDAGRGQRSADRHRGNRFRNTQSAVDIPLLRYDTSGRQVSRRAGVLGR